MWGFDYLTRQQFSLNAAAHRLARTPGPTTSPRIVTSAFSVLVRLRQSLPSGSLLHTESAITTRLNHQLPRQDSHLQVYQRTKAAQTPSNPNQFRPYCSRIGCDDQIRMGSTESHPTGFGCGSAALRNSCTVPDGRSVVRLD